MPKNKNITPIKKVWRNCKSAKGGGKYLREEEKKDKVKANAKGKGMKPVL